MQLGPAACGASAAQQEERQARKPRGSAQQTDCQAQHCGAKRQPTLTKKWMHGATARKSKTSGPSAHEHTLETAGGAAVVRAGKGGHSALPFGACSRPVHALGLQEGGRSVGEAKQRGLHLYWSSNSAATATAFDFGA